MLVKQHKFTDADTPCSHDRIQLKFALWSGHIYPRMKWRQMLVLDYTNIFLWQYGDGFKLENAGIPSSLVLLEFHEQVRSHFYLQVKIYVEVDRLILRYVMRLLG